MRRFLFTVFFSSLALIIHAQMVEMPLSPMKLPCRIKPDTSHVFIIKSNGELEEKGCSDFDFPFQNKSIIGVDGSCGGCSRPVVRLQLFQDTKTRKYLVIATLVQFGACRPIWYYHLEMACDRLNPDYDMEIRFRSEFPK